ncbi:MAG: hypothetical protein AABY18_01335 [Candidatus Thermoplasmatota archaeon]
MDAPCAAVRLSVVAVGALLVTLVAVSVVEEGASASTLVTKRDGSPFTLPAEEGAYEAQWLDQPPGPHGV